MKKLLVAMMLMLPALVYGTDYKYNKVVFAQAGSDNISIDNVIVSEANGNISIHNDIITIDGKEYKLKPSRKEEVYKSKGYLFKFVYTNGQLSCVQKFQYDKVFRYYVNQEDDKSFAVH